MSCKKCDGTNCFYTLNELYNIVLNIEKEVKDLVKRRINKYLNATSCEDSTEKLNLTKKVILDYIKEKLRTGESCICNEHINKAVNYIREYIPKIQDIEVLVNREGEEKWILDNIQCANKEQWKRIAYKICAEIDVDITLETTLCDFALEVYLENITCETIEAISMASIACKSSVEVARTNEECKIDFSILSEKCPDCLDKNTYLAAVKNHKLTYEGISRMCESGIKMGLNEKGRCYIQTEITSYNLDEINFNSFFESDKISNSGFITLKPSNKNILTKEYTKSPC